MDSLIGFYIYAAIFRLAIIAAGIVSIILGYRLFVHDTGSERRTDVGAQADRFKIIIRNAAPGTVFAAFGAIIIAVMLSQGNPEIILKDVHTVIKDSQGNSQSEVRSQSASAKGNGNSNNERSEAVQRFDRAFDEGVRLEKDGEIKAAITAYNKALSESEVPLGKAGVVFNNLAWIYKEQHRLDEAAALANVATTIKKDVPGYFDTLALILLDQREYKKAERAAEIAVDLAPYNKDYEKTLQQVHASQEDAQ
ncbi:MAG: hypothetical protein SD837_21810 [Candidatus Electrothrix scaldis]|nr:MAG: hypothetical protein SD837_21810 [Candidatus Electrothrix sp. GW3-3]